ncbi:MAG: hypothetical protein L0Y72_28630 [Gemmataceae bacterium]|nr:hypothetical protein [Gemmataceae bacterium]
MTRLFAAAFVLSAIVAKGLHAADVIDAKKAQTIQQTFADARRAAEDIPDHWFKFKTFLVIAHDEWKASLKEESTKDFDRAFKLAEDAPEEAFKNVRSQRASWLFQVATWQALGDPKGARDHLQRIPPTPSEKQFDRQDYERAYAIAWIAKTLADAGKTEEAHEIAKKIDIPHISHEALVGIQLTSKDVPGATQVAEKESTLFYQCRLYHRIAKHQLDAGRKVEAKEILNKCRQLMEGKWKEAGLLEAGELAVLIARTGDFKASLEWMDKIPEPENKLFSFRNKHLTQIWIAAGNLEKALTFARLQAKSNPENELPMQLVAVARAENKDSKGALETIEEMSEPYFKTNALLAVSRLHFKAARTKEARAHALEAIAIADKTPDEETKFEFQITRASLIHTICEACAEFGAEADARAWIGRQINPHFQAHGLSGVALGLSKRGQVVQK